VATDLSKKRKLNDLQAAAVETEKPWEKTEVSEETDYRWNICENCQ